ncbi:MAG: DUF443 family protein [Patescibacteria group bacterium]
MEKPNNKKNNELNQKSEKQKEWYASGWGLVLVILLLPLFLIWYIWAKTEWNNSIKIISTLIILVLLFAINSSFEEEINVEKVQEDNKKVVREENEESIVFDVPSLLNKKISYFTKQYGEPTNDNPEPTETAIEGNSADTWTKRFEKDGYGISVEYNTNNGEVVEIFFSKARKNIPLEETWVTDEEKEELLKASNIDLSSNKYDAGFIKSIQDPSRFTGVKVEKL